MKRNCDLCGAEYEAARSSSRFCSAACRSKARRMREALSFGAKYGSMSVPVRSVPMKVERYDIPTDDVVAYVAEAHAVASALSQAGKHAHEKVLRPVCERVGRSIDEALTREGL